jgi:hypothetical protein
MWIPKWLGEHYCRLYAEFGTHEFEFEEALGKFGLRDRELRMILSNLRRSGFVDVLARRGRKRIYRVADPSEVIFLAGKGIDLRGLPEVIRPVLRSYLKGLFDRYGERVISVVLYGSFSVGKYDRESDIDLLLVIEDYGRDEPLDFPAAGALVGKQWQLEKRYHNIQPYPLNQEQARYHRPIYLDMTVDGKILYDKGGFIARVFDEIRRRLAELGAKRYQLPSGAWYWVLKPEIREGEVVEI